MSGKERLMCGRCQDTYPKVPILKCTKSVPGGILLCSSCHKRLHPRCSFVVNAVTHSDKVCDACFIGQSTVVCPQCVNSIDAGGSTQLCGSCSDSLHTDIRNCHRDHLQPMPSQT